MHSNGNVLFYIAIIFQNCNIYSVFFNLLDGGVNMHDIGHHKVSPNQDTLGKSKTSAH